MKVDNIYNIDCMEGFKDLGDESIQLVLTDIPYEEVTEKGEKRAQYEGQLRNLNKGQADVMKFELERFLDEVYRVVKGSVYVFCGISQLSYVFNYFERKEDVMTRHCVWVKSNPSPLNGQHKYLNSVEDIVFVKKRGTKFNRHCDKAHFEYPVQRSKIHPTQKNFNLIEYLIKSSSDEGDLVLDPCCGSGVVGIASYVSNRDFIGFEIEEDYYKKADRWYELVKKGMSWKEGLKQVNYEIEGDKEGEG